MPHIDPLIIPIVAILMPLVLVPTVVMLKHRHKRRQWEHLERMRTLEQHLPARVPSGVVGSGAVAAIGGGVPAAAVAGAVITTLLWDRSAFDGPAVPAVAWGCAVLISGGGFITSLLMALLQAKTQERLNSIATHLSGDCKPAFDPDTFDVVGARG